MSKKLTKYDESYSGNRYKINYFIQVVRFGKERNKYESIEVEDY